MHTIESEILGSIEAVGPVSLEGLIYNVKDQCTDKATLEGSDYSIRCDVVDVINKLCRSGIIELYDTGDAWDMV